MSECSPAKLRISTSTGGSINIDSSRVTLERGAHLTVSGVSGNAGGVFIGSQPQTDYLYVDEGASIEANSTSGDAGNIDLTGAGVYFHGQLAARGRASQASFRLRLADSCTAWREQGDQAHAGITYSY